MAGTDIHNHGDKTSAHARRPKNLPQLNHPRRKFLQSIAAAGIASTGLLSHAGTWPERPVKLIVPSPAGSAPDITARVLADRLSGVWGQGVVVDNRGRSGGIAATSSFIRAPSDGYTLALLHTAVLCITPHLFKNPQFNVDTDLQPVGTAVNGPMVIAVNPKLGVKTLPELFELARKQPGKYVYATPFLNSVLHLTGEMVFRTAGARFQTVPYNGTAAIVTAMLGNEGADVVVDALAALVPFIKSGKITALGVTSGKRLPGLESVPTVSETLSGFEAAGWFALYATARTPGDLVEKINQDLQTVVQMPEASARFAEIGLYPNPLSAKASAAFINKDRERWARLIKELGIRPE